MLLFLHVFSWFVDSFSDQGFVFRIGASVKMEHHFQAALDPRKQELLEARFIGARVSQLKTKTKQKTHKTVMLHIVSARYRNNNDNNVCYKIIFIHRSVWCLKRNNTASVGLFVL